MLPMTLLCLGLALAAAAEPVVRRLTPREGAVVGGGGGAVRAGDALTLLCRASHRAAPHLYSWYRNGEALVRNTSRLRLLGQLLHLQAAEPSDDGVYSCSVETPGDDGASYEHSRHNFALSVHGRSRRQHARRAAPAEGAGEGAAEASSPPPPPPMRFSPAPLDKKLELNATGRIHCKVLGGVRPSVAWYKNLNESLPADAHSANGTLSFTPTLRRHRGNYTCRAVDAAAPSSAAAALHATIAVDVVVSPRVLEPAAGGVLDAWAGDAVWLHCRALGDPAPTTHWDRNLTVLTQAQVAVETEDGDFVGNSTRIRLYRNGSLALLSAAEEDSDRYGCIAGSSAGLARHELALRVHPEGGAEGESGGGVGSKAVVVSVSVAAAYMLLVLALMLYCRRRRATRRRRGEKMEMGETDGGGGGQKLMEGEAEGAGAGGGRSNGGAAHARNGRLKHDADTGAARSDNSELSAASRASKRSNQYEQLAVPRTLLTDHVTLGRGEFGEVILAKVDVRRLRRAQAAAAAAAEREVGAERAPESEEPRVRPVMVKALGSHEETHLAEFRRQLEMFSRVRQENVVRLLALCTERQPHYMLLEYTDWGELKQFLLATRTPAEAAAAAAGGEGGRRGAAAAGARATPAAPLARAQAAALAAQLARAGRALAEKRLVHRDIGARNCLVSSRLQLKLSLPALTRGPHSHEYYKHLNQVIPLRWLPLEAVLEGDYSTKSDVYMFAATVWEIFHKAELPFSRSNDAAVLAQLQAGELAWSWSDAANAPPALTALMERCWARSPADRPQFEALCREMSDALQTMPRDADAGGAAAPAAPAAPADPVTADTLTADGAEQP